MPTPGGFHTVGAGESWASIAGKAYGDQRYYLRLMEANPGIKMLTPGTRLTLPDFSAFESSEYIGEEHLKTYTPEKPFISEVNFYLSSRKSGNKYGHNIVGDSRYTPSNFGQAMEAARQDERGVDIDGWLAAGGGDIRPFLGAGFGFDLGGDASLGGYPMGEPGNELGLGWGQANTGAEWDDRPWRSLHGSPYDDFPSRPMVIPEEVIDMYEAGTLPHQIQEKYLQEYSGGIPGYPETGYKTDPTTGDVWTEWGPANQPDWMKERVERDEDGNIIQYDVGDLRHFNVEDGLIRWTGDPQVDQLLLQRYATVYGPEDQTYSLKDLWSGVGSGFQHAIQEAKSNLKDAGTLFSTIAYIQGLAWRARNAGSNNDQYVWTYREGEGWVKEIPDWDSLSDPGTFNIFARGAHPFLAEGWSGIAADDEPFVYRAPDGDVYTDELPEDEAAEVLTFSTIMYEVNQAVAENNGVMPPDAADATLELIEEEAIKRGFVKEDGTLDQAAFFDSLNLSEQTFVQDLLMTVTGQSGGAFTPQVQSASGWGGDFDGLQPWWPQEPITGAWYGGDNDPYMGGGGYPRWGNSGGYQQNIYRYTPPLTRWKFL